MNLNDLDIQKNIVTDLWYLTLFKRPILFIFL